MIANADAPQIHAVLTEGVGHRPSRVDRMNYSFGLFVMCFVTNRSWPAVAHRTIVLWRAVEGFAGRDFRRLGGATDPGLYLHRPAAADPSLQPPGHDGFYVLAPVPNLRAPIVRDFYTPLLGQNGGDRALLLAVRIAAVVFGLLPMPLALGSTRILAIAYLGKALRSPWPCWCCWRSTRRGWARVGRHFWGAARLAGRHACLVRAWRPARHRQRLRRRGRAAGGDGNKWAVLAVERRARRSRRPA